MVTTIVIILVAIPWWILKYRLWKMILGVKK